MTEILDSRAISRDLFSATIGSICCCYTGQPFDTVKVRMQTRPDLFPGVISSTTNILRDEVCIFQQGSFFLEALHELYFHMICFCIKIHSTKGHFCVLERSSPDGGGDGKSRKFNRPSGKRTFFVNF